MDFTIFISSRLDHFTSFWCVYQPTMAKREDRMGHRKTKRLPQSLIRGILFRTWLSSSPWRKCFRVVLYSIDLQAPGRCTTQTSTQCRLCALKKAHKAAEQHLDARTRSKLPHEEPGWMRVDVMLPVKPKTRDFFVSARQKTFFKTSGFCEYNSTRSIVSAKKLPQPTSG